MFHDRVECAIVHTTASSGTKKLGWFILISGFLGCLSIGAVLLYGQGLTTNKSDVTPTLFYQSRTASAAPSLPSEVSHTPSRPLQTPSDLPGANATPLHPTVHPSNTRIPIPTSITRLPSRTLTAAPIVRCEPDGKGFVIEKQDARKFTVRFQILCTNTFDFGRDLNIRIAILRGNASIGESIFSDRAIGPSTDGKIFTSLPYETNNALAGYYRARVRYIGDSSQEFTFEIPFP